jgi:hypothetical protein
MVWGIYLVSCVCVVGLLALADRGKRMSRIEFLLGE